MRSFDDLGRVGADHKRTGRSAGAEDDGRSQNDSPAVHQESSTSTGASTVRSRSLAKSSADGAPAKVITAPVTREMAIQPKAAFHIILANVAERSAASCSLSRLRMRFSKE